MAKLHPAANMRNVVPTGHESYFGRDELIVSKTDLHGKITYANRIFLRVAGFDEAELIGQPHSIIRHPDMPRSVFGLMWQTLHAKREIFAYVVNLARNGDHYWVLAHVTPSYVDGEVVGYHSSRRKPEASAISASEALYAELRDVERRASSRVEAVSAGIAHLEARLAERGQTYEEFVFSL